ncbi:hypothetical protein LINPERPRIM_LOCUS8558, partial [Linum perenne]
IAGEPWNVPIDLAEVSITRAGIEAESSNWPYSGIEGGSSDMRIDLNLMSVPDADNVQHRWI